MILAAACTSGGVSAAQTFGVAAIVLAAGLTMAIIIWVGRR